MLASSLYFNCYDLSYASTVFPDPAVVTSQVNTNLHSGI